jgi:hypothetical protein
MVRDFGPQNGGLMVSSPFTSILYASSIPREYKWGSLPRRRAR